ERQRMQASVMLRGSASSRVCAALLVAELGVAAISVAGCSGEAELTTELPGSEPPSMASNPASAGGSMSTGGAGEPVRSSNEARPAPSGLAGEALDPGTAEERSGVSPALPLAPLDVPSGDHCAPVADWDPAWLEFEQQVLLLVNERRAQPADCGEDGQFGPAGPVVMEPILRCSARLQSLDMFERDFFDHT